MFYHIFVPLAEYHIFFNVFRYITFRSVAAFVTSLLCSFLVGPIVIKMMKRNRALEVINDHLPETHRTKKGTPTMGGLIMLFSILVSTLL